eukprot:55151-Eustigmatos_ZCMA.PRE.1
MGIRDSIYTLHKKGYVRQRKHRRHIWITTDAPTHRKQVELTTPACAIPRSVAEAVTSHGLRDSSIYCPR